MAAAAKPAKPAYELSGWERFKKDVVRDKWLYLLILPGMLFMLIFRYIPIFGNVIAFMDFNPYNMWNSTWVGFDQFSSFSISRRSCRLSTTPSTSPF